MRNQTVGLFAIAATLLATSFSACGGCSEDDEKSGKAAGEDAAEIPEFDAGSIHTEKITPEVLLPVIQAIGFHGATPHRVTVEFSREVIDDAPRAIDDDTIFEITPETPGTVKFTSNSTLEFEPRDGFQPNTTYRVSLSAVGSKKGPQIPPTPWTHEFTTPEFAFVGLSGAYLDESNRQVELDMRFSAPVDPEKIRKFAEWQANGNDIGNVSYAKGSEPHIVRVFLMSSSIESGGTLELDLDAGVPFGDGTITAGAGESEVSIEIGKPVNLYKALRKEGPQGYFVEIVCRDESAPGGYRYYYDRTSYDSHRVSKRCLPSDEQIQSMISFHPPVKFRVASGEGGFNLIGDFKRGNYALKIEAGLRTVDGGIVRKTFEQEITIPSRSPDIGFVDKGRYVPRSEWKKLAVNHLNVDEVEVSVRYVPERNAIFWMSGGSEAADYRTSMLIAKERVKFTAKTDQKTTSFVDVERLVGEVKPGVYEVRVDGLGKNDAIRLVPTDMNIVVKRSATRPGDKWPSDALVWALNMKTLEPIGGVRMDLVRPNGESVATCDTDTEGACKLAIPTDTIDPSTPFAIVAKKGEDFTYVRYQDVQTRAADAQIAGKPYLAESAYHAALWSDRGVYRPGETAHIVAVLRNDDYFAPTDGIPVEVEIKDPRQRTLTKKVLKANEAGVITLDQTFADFATTGFYNVDLRIAKKSIASHRFNVEEFVPERMKVSATAGAKDYEVGEEVSINVGAEYLFGGSAEGSDVELTCRVVPETFEPEENSDYYYGLAAKDPGAIDLQPVQATLDGDGTARPACPAPESNARLRRTGRIEATAAVFEAGSGRTTTAMAKATLHPARYYIGLKSAASSVTPGKDAAIHGVIVDWNGKPYQGVDEVEIQFIRLEREYWWYYDDDEGESNYGRNIRPVVEGTRKVKVKDGKFRLNASPGEQARSWVVAAVAPGARTELEFETDYYYDDYYYDDEDGYYGYRRVDETPRPARPTSIKISGPDEIKVGVKSTFEIQVPFAGRMLVTTETFEVLTHEWIDVKAGKHTYPLQLAKFSPNVYVSALLVKDPHADSKETFMPDRAYGVRSVKVEPSERLHGVELLVPEEIRPNSTLTVELNLGKRDAPTYATVAAIDEGILSLTRYESPKPSKALFARRALGVDTFETVGWALQSTPGGPSSKTGGGWDEDGEFGDGKGRIMPIKPVALWSGLVKVPESGKVSVSFEVPRYRGALRVMAVTADTSRTGAAEGKVYVREPIVMQTTLPRFLSAGDEIQIPVFVTNMTGANQDVKVTMEIVEEATPGLQSKEGGAIVSMRGPKTKTLSLTDQKSDTAIFAVRGLRQAGVAKFVIKAESPAYTAIDEGIVPFRPSGPQERNQHIVKLKEGTNDLSSYLAGWVPTSETTTVWVTSVPYGEAFAHLKYLIRYPYGCIEQTTSSTRPLLYVGELVGQIDPESLKKKGGIEKMVAHGVNRVLSMQTSSGGFSYWPGGTTADDWGTAYATHMLLDAKKQGFEIPQDRLDAALEYIDDSVERRTSSSGHGYKYAEPYMHYVLARSGKGHKARIQKLVDELEKKKNRTGQDAEQEYLLKSALWLAGDRRYEKYLRKPDVSKLNDVREARWSYYSDRRRRGFVLSLFHDMFGVHKDGEALAKLVANNLSENRSSRYYTTQEIMWGVTGLGKWVSGNAADFGDAKLVIDGKRPKPEKEVKGRADRTWSIYRLSEYEEVAVELQGKKGTVYAVITSSGVRENSEPKIGGHGISVSRRYYDSEGNQLEPNHTLGDLIYTEITLTNTSSHSLYNLALVDRLPGGWEIENPRLGRGTLPDWVDGEDTWQPEYMNIRDDRIEAFGTLSRNASLKLFYAVRAVSAGQFFAPPAEIEGMYEPEYWARDEPVNVKVKGPWDALLD